MQSDNIDKRDDLEMFVNQLIFKLNIFEKPKLLGLFEKITSESYVYSWNLSKRPWF